MNRQRFSSKENVSRRAFLKTAGVVAGGLLLSGCNTKLLSRDNRRKPNIIYVLADDLGYGDLSCYGQKKFTTPNIDRMAKEGMMFANHYSGSTVCAPSRCCLMTGMDTGHARIRGNYETGPGGFGAELPLLPSDVTVAEVLKASGYRTAVIGKWGIGMDGTTGEPAKQGFDEYYGFLNQAYAHYYYPEYIYHNGEKVQLPGNKSGKREQYVQDLFTDENLKFIENNKDRPFFLYAAYTIPHAEMLVPEDSLNEFKGQFPEKPYINNGSGGPNGPEGFGAYHSQEYPNAAFAAMMTRLDRDMGKILDKLKELGIDEDTLVIFSSDNGSHAEGGHDPDFFESNGPLKGYKRDLCEGGIRVPMIARWPGKIKAGSRTDLISAFWDFLPTAADIAGAPEPKDIDGISFLPALLGQDHNQKKHKYLYWEFHERKNSEQALRMGKWKAIRHSPDDPVELYDLQYDIGEKHNIADKHPAIVTEIKKLFIEARTPSEYWPLKTS